MGACCGNKKNVVTDKKMRVNNDDNSRPVQIGSKRWDLLAMPHKGFRKMWADLLIAAGSCDFSSEREFSNFQKNLIASCKSYIENDIFHDLNRKEPEVYREWTKDHDSHIKELEDFMKLTEEIRREPP